MSVASAPYQSPHAFVAGSDDPILVTGAAGYVGVRVVENLLRRGFRRIRCLVRSSVRARELSRLAREYPTAELRIEAGNLLSASDCARASDGVAVIYHLAAGIEKSFAGCFLNSVVTTRNLLDAATANPGLRRFVNVGSLAEYANYAIPRGGPLDERTAVDTRCADRHEAYAYAKVKQSQLVRDYAQTRGLPFVIVRPGVVFGPGKRKISDRVGISTFGPFLHLGLGNRLPLTYVDNCADAIVLAGLVVGIEGETFNIVDDDPPTSREFLRQYVRRVKRIRSIPVPYPIWYMFCYCWELYAEWSEGQLPPVFNRPTCSIYWKGNVYPNAKARQSLGWPVGVPMQEGLDRFFAYLKDGESARG
ncbi:MAG: NAD(P)-dependent oxidoreductase [Burkholderiales bacterium]